MIAGVAIVFVAMALSIFNLYYLRDAGIHDIMTVVIRVVSLFSAVVYFVYGFRKNAAAYYKAFIFGYLLYLLLDFTGILGCCSDGVIGLICVYTAIIAFGCVCILTFSSDLGRAKSYIVCAVSLAAGVCLMAVMLSVPGGVPGHTCSQIARFLLSVVLCIMVVAKYTDKKERGTK